MNNKYKEGNAESQPRINYRSWYYMEKTEILEQSCQMYNLHKQVICLAGLFAETASGRSITGAATAMASAWPTPRE